VEWLTKPARARKGTQNRGRFDFAPNIPPIATTFIRCTLKPKKRHRICRARAGTGQSGQRSQLRPAGSITSEIGGGAGTQVGIVPDADHSRNGDPVEHDVCQHGRMTADATLPLVPLGASAIPVSAMALGSWRTFERLPAERGQAVMRAARAAGITFLDDARYNDETGAAPIPTGYSEVVFGEVFRATGWHRDEVVIANKLWWEFWPTQTPSQELAGSLGRMGLDHVDLIYSDRAPADVPLDDIVGMIAELIEAGQARAWGAFNWSPGQLEQAWQIADRTGAPGPCATQPGYNLIRREVAEDPDLVRLAAARGIAIVASYALAGGVLTGKYAAAPRAGRAAGQLDQPLYAAAATAARELTLLAADIGRDPAQLAMAFVLLNPSVTTLLFGATSPEQVMANVGALAVAAELTPAEVGRLRAIGSPAAAR
jgi:aryl-alcohol dehydrogenase-like predicted oxidoreductase